MEGWTIAGVGTIAVAVIGAVMAQAWSFQSGLQKTIDGLRQRLDDHDARLIECEKDRAALRQRVADLGEK